MLSRIAAHVPWAVASTADDSRRRGWRSAAWQAVQASKALLGTSIALAEFRARQIQRLRVGFERSTAKVPVSNSVEHNAERGEYRWWQW